MNDKVKRVLSTLTLSALVATNAAALMPKVAKAAGAEVNKLSGETRYQTADKINQELGTEFKNVVLASGYEAGGVDNTIDVLSAAPLAHALNAPIVILDHKAVKTEDVVAKMKGLKAENVYIATGVFGDEVVKALEAQGIKVVKLGGKDRFETAYNIAKELEKVKGTPSAAVVVNGYKKADAVSIAPIAAAKGWPILLATENDINDNYKGSYAKYYVIGGDKVLTSAVVDEVKGTRIAGADRYFTNLAIIREFKSDLKFDRVFVARGEDNNLVDSLVGATLAAKNGSAIVLVKDTISDAAKAELLKVKGIEKAKYTIFGGVVSETAVKTVADAIVNEIANRELKVESVSANNLKNIVVKFNKEVEKKTITSSNVKVYDGTTLLTGVTLNLLDDNKTLLITNNGTYTQLKEYKVVVENVEVKGDSTKKVEKAEKTVTVVDTTLPTVESVTATSPKTLEIVFSEPIQTGNGAGQFPTSSAVLTDVVQIDGINAYATPNVDEINTKNKVVLTLNTALTAGDHKIKVANLKDHANLPIAAKEFTVNIAADSVAPQVTAVEVLNKDKVKVTFNEPVDNATVQSNLANIKVNGTAVTGATSKEGGKVYEFTLGQSLTLASVVEAKFEYKGIKDNYGNEVKDAKTFTFKAVDDTTAPTVTDVKVNSDNTIEVTFSEDVTGFTGTTTVALYNKDNKKLSNTVTVAKKVIDGVASDKVYTLTIAGGSSLSGAHTIKILKDNVTDLSVRTNKFAEATFPVTLNDKVAPTVTKVEYVNETTGTDFNSDADVKDSKVTIYFSEAMDATTLTNKANYLINGTPLADVSGTVTLTPANDNKSVTITVNRGSSDTQLAFANNTDLRVIAVKDAAGNTLSSSQVNANLGSGSGNLGLISEFVSNPAFTTAVDKVEVISKNQLKLYAKSGYLFSAIDANKIKFTENQSSTDLIPGLQVTAVSIAADGKTATLTLNNNVTADGKFDGSDANTTASVVSLYADADAIALTNGAKLQALAANSGLNVIDKTAPSISTVTKDTTNADTIVLTFDEAVSCSNDVGLAGDLVVKLADGTVLNPAAGDYTVVDAVSSDEKLQIKITKPGVKDTNVTVELKDGRYITDVASNVATTFTVKDVMDGTNKAQITEKTAPTVSATLTKVNDTTFKLTFSEVVDKTLAETVTNYTLAGTGKITGNPSAAVLDDTGKVVTLTVPTTANFTTGQTLTVTVSGVQDLAGNVVDSNIDDATFTK